MDVMEKLVELLMEFPLAYDVCDKQEKKECGDTPCCECLANHLIAHGVTVQEWISVNDRLPSVKKMIDGEEYYKTVAVRIEGYEVEKIAYYDDEEKCWLDTDDLPVFEKVTHWYELPEWKLPQPPKGE